MASRLLRVFALFILTFWVGAVQAHADPTLYVSNFNNNTITTYDPSTGAFLGTLITGPGDFGFNGVLVGPYGSIFVTDQIANSVNQYALNGAYLGTFSSSLIDSPQDLTFGPDGAIYVVSSANDKILRFDPLTPPFFTEFADLSANGHAGPISLAFGSDGNLYATSFDSGQLFKIDGTTGQILDVKNGDAGFGFAAATLGPDGNLYFGAINLDTFEGSVFRYDIGTGVLAQFSQDTGGFFSPGGIAFNLNGELLVANIAVDDQFNDVGSSILRFNGSTGEFINTLVADGNGLNVPFFMTVADVPEPSSLVLLLSGIGAIARLRRNRKS